MSRLYLTLLLNGLMIAGVILFQIWTGGALAEDLTVKLLSTGGVTLLFLSFIAIIKMDFGNFESRTLGFTIIGLASALQGLALLAIWNIWTPDAFFFKIVGTCGVLLGLSFYVLNLREDLIREKRQKDDDFLG